jgi:hypothetical protein
MANRLSKEKARFQAALNEVVKDILSKDKPKLNPLTILKFMRQG